MKPLRFTLILNLNEKLENIILPIERENHEKLLEKGKCFEQWGGRDSLQC